MCERTVIFSFCGLGKGRGRRPARGNVIPISCISTRSFTFCVGKTFVLAVANLRFRSVIYSRFCTGERVLCTCWWFGLVLSQVIPSEVQDNTGDNVEKPGKIFTEETCLLYDNLPALNTLFCGWKIYSVFLYHFMSQVCQASTTCYYFFFILCFFVVQVCFMASSCAVCFRGVFKSDPKP